ncbi:3-oxoacyl-ACP reductase FabG [Portibacter lacus]|uniref:3-oxoacyl-[acyl-carrier-protein] reductase FabG n=1 Tax=Portibacter lacus TaxID=1099794 RepID=A0AA37WEH3_9BACT|nr:3-oxoacyl-ACP reductase FabG [Portibacter lacus]GLR16050.1 3-oxoacyl-[acyl-carrier-protein] reductase FabG [Portibacter lacus]
MFNLKNQVAIVTGGARGIGAGIAKVFIDAGANVILWDVLDSGQQTADDLGDKATFRKVDVTNSDSVEEAVNEAIEDHGKIDILINNAGIIRDKSFSKMTFEEWNAVINVNLNSLFIVTKLVLPHMKAAKYGRIISASSVNGSAGAFGQTNYAATKAGVQGFTRSLCKEVGKYGITANCVAPGFIASDMTASMPQDVIDQGIKQIPVGRIGTPEDMGYAYLFLASKEASFINGITLHANGGSYAI